MIHRADEQRNFWLGVLLAVLAATGLRAWGLHDLPLEVDEVYEVTHRTPSFLEIAKLQEGFPPLGRGALGCWIEWFGDGSARWFAVLTGVGGVVAVALFGRQVAGARVGIIAAWLAAISANHIYYSQQARVYALYFLFATLAMAAAWRLRKSDSMLSWGLFGAASWLSLATHYYAVLLIGLLFGLLVVEKSWSGRTRAAIAALVFGVACLPLAYCLQIDLGRPKLGYTTIEFDFEAWAYTYLTLISGFTLGPPLNALRDLSAADGIRAMAPWALAVGAVVGLLAVSCARRLPWRDSAWLVILLVAPSLMAAAAATASPTGYSHRYILWVLAPLLVVLAAGIDRWRERPLVAAATAGLVVLSMTAIGNRRFDARYHIDDFAQVLRMIEEQAPESPVLATPHYFANAAEYHLGQNRVVVPCSNKPGEEQDWADQLPELADAVQDAEFYWIVTQSFPDDDSRQAVRDDLVQLLGAEHLGRISWTIDVYRAKADALRRAVAVQQRSANSD